MSTFHKLKAFFLKDYRIDASYKLAYVLSIVNSFFPLLSFFFIGKIVGDTESLEPYGGDYFSFALIGLSFSRYFQLAISTFSNSISRAQMAGCLEAILSSQTSPQAVVLLSSVYSFISAGVQLLVMLIAGTLIFGADFSHINIPAALVAFALSLATFVGLGVVSAAGTIIFKKGEPFGWLFGAVSGLLGGAVFPVSVFPEWLQVLSKVIPIRYALEALRMSMLRGQGIGAISDELVVLGGMAMAMLPLSLWIFTMAVERGKRTGTLVHY